MLKIHPVVWVFFSLCILGGNATDALEIPPSAATEKLNKSQFGTSALYFTEGEVDLNQHPNTSCAHEGHSEGGIHLVSFRWKEVGVYFTVTAFVIIAGFIKIVFHHLKWLANTIPESCVLVVLGLALGLIVFFTEETNSDSLCRFNVPLPQFTSDLFFFILLPPIVLESSYSLHDRAFFDNIGTVIVYAFIGTMINVFAIGPTLYGLASVGAMGNMNISMGESLVFSSLISAVDPVAVLVIFQELGVNKNLYFLVFGESLLNDGVTVVIYNTMNSFLQMDHVPAPQYALAVVSFILVVFGGISIGFIFGFLTALITKSTTDVRVVEPLAMLGLSYLCYITAELFHFSGIISLIVCGLVQAHYAFRNISQKSYTCVKYFTKMASATSDTIIFMFLGMVLVSDDHQWHTGFVLWSVLLCLVYRFIIVFALTFIMNHYRIKKIGLQEQFIAAYGGLRGAVAFSLVEMLDDTLDKKSIFVTTTLVVVLFTIFVQGVTIKPLVNLLQIQRRRSDRKNLNEEINDTAMDHIMAGVEEILGQHGDFYLRALMIHYNDRFLKKWFLRPSCESKLKRLFEKIAISEHYAHLYGPVAMIEDKVKPICHSEPAKLVRQRTRTVSISPSLKDEVLLEPGLMMADDEDVELMQEEVQLRAKKKRKPSLFPTRRSSRRVGASDDHLPHLPNQAEFEVDEDRDDEAGALDNDVSKRKSSEATQALRKAFRDNPYNKLHYKYNRNLVGEEDQELSEHLNRRHLNARRMSSLASTQITAATQNIQQSRPKTDGAAGGVTDNFRSGLYDGVAELRERHQRRRHTMAVRRRHQRPPLQTCLSSPESSGSLSSPSAAVPPPVTLNTLRETSPVESSDISIPTSPREAKLGLIGKRPGVNRSTSIEEDEEELALMGGRERDSDTGDDDQREERV